MKTPAVDRPLRILVADDHGVVREGVKRLLEGASRHWVIAEAAGGLEARDKLRAETYDVAILDLSMPDMSGLELLRRVRAELPKLPVVMLSMHAEEQYALRAYRAGANGYVTKDAATSELIDAVCKVAESGVYVSRSLGERLVLQFNAPADVSPHEHLSDRELDVLRRLVAGERPTEIAQALHLSVKTVSTHKTRIQEKLGLTGTAALVRYAMAHGLAPEAGGTAPGTL